MKITDLLSEQVPPPAPAPGATAMGGTLNPQSQMVAPDPAAQQKQQQLQIAQHQKQIQDRKKQIQDQIADLTKQITDLKKEMVELK